MTNFPANSTCLKTPYLTALSSTSSFTTIPSTKYTMVLSLEEERAKK
jgi:Na+/H+-dicarboxylate symporter